MSQGPGRNDPCPCGSGRKYRHCCGAAGAAVRPRGAPRGIVPRVVDYARKRLWDLQADARSVYMAPVEELDPDHRTEFFGRYGELAEVLNTNFHDWLLADYEDPDTGDNVIDRYLDDRGWREGQRECAWLESLRDHRLSLYEVQAVHPEEGATLRDVLRGGEPIEVVEYSATHSINTRDYVVTRVVPFDDAVYLSGAALRLAREHAHTVAEKLTSQLTERIESPDSDDWEDFLQTAGPYFVEAYLAPYLRSAPLPQVSSPGSEPLHVAIQRFTFATGDYATCRACLARHESLIEEEDDPGRFTWLGASRREGRSTRVLGWITLDTEGGRLETHSQGRLERGRALLEALIGEHARFLPAELRDPQHAVNEADDTSDRDDDSGDLEVKRRILDEHYANWCDEPNAALGDKTPRQAVETAAGRQTVIDLLEDFERQEARAARPGERYDFGWIWRALGLERRASHVKSDHNE